VQWSGRVRPVSPSASVGTWQGTCRSRHGRHVGIRTISPVCSCSDDVSTVLTLLGDQLKASSREARTRSSDDGLDVTVWSDCGCCSGRVVNHACIDVVLRRGYWTRAGHYGAYGQVRGRASRGGAKKRVRDGVRRSEDLLAQYSHLEGVVHQRPDRNGSGALPADQRQLGRRRKVDGQRGEGRDLVSIHRRRESCKVRQ